jgi:hypothetical protein
MTPRATLAAFSILFLAGAAAAQAAGGGAVAGIGRTVEAVGRSVAARELQRKIGSTLVRAVAREKSGQRKVTAGARPQASRPSAIAPVNDTSAYFKPDPRADSMARIADELGTNPTERQQLRQLFEATKVAFEKEVAAKGRSNNLPAAFTFFIASTVTVYRDDPEPSDEAIDRLWNGLSGALTESPEMSKLSDAEKQQLYDMLVAFSGFVLAGYMESKSSGDSDSLKIFQTLSGELIRTVLQR